MTYQVMPNLSSDEYAELKADIAARGVMVPIEFDELGNVLDGHHRLAVCKELGIKEYPKVIRAGLDEAGKRLHARKLNMARRHLTQEQRREMIRAQLMETPEKSDRQIASGLGADHKTISAQRKALESIGEIPQCSRITADGRTYPAERKSIAIFNPTPKLERAIQNPVEREKILPHIANGLTYDAARREVKITESRERIAHIEPSSNNVDIYTTDNKYAIIYADPPWGGYFKAGNKNQDNHYPLMTIVEICELPVQRIADENAVLFLWVTFPILDRAFDVIKAWGFSYSTCAFCWVKQNKNGDGYFFGNGNWTHANAELCLLATKGSITRLDAAISQLIVSPIEEHSKKPDATRELITRLVGEMNRVELFSRNKADGWDAWGLEAGG